MNSHKDLYIKNITKLFGVKPVEEKFSLVLQYIPEDDNINISITNINMRKKIDEILDDYGFPEYKKITYAIYNYIKKYDNNLESHLDNSEDSESSESSEEYDNDSEDSDDSVGDGKYNDVYFYYNINVMVDEKSKYAKNHTYDCGYVRLYTILFLHYGDKLLFKGMILNAKLVTERIPLTNGAKKYPSNINLIEDGPENDTNCVICQSNRGTLVVTPCHHKFHIDCIRCTPKLICPLCKVELIDFLKTQGITDEEIKERLADQEREIELENHCSSISLMPIEDIRNMNELDFIRLCMESIKLSNGDIIAYDDLIFDMNANASQLFAELSSIKSKNEKGVFIYLYDSPVEFIMDMRDSSSESKAVWTKISELEDTPVYETVKNRLSRIKDFSQEYVVGIIIENISNFHIIHKDANINDKFAIRIHQDDILHSLLKLVRCRCIGNSPNASNREYKWARNELNKIKKRQNKKRKNNKMMIQ